NAAGTIERVDRPHVMAMSAGDRRARLQIDAKRCAEQRLLRVVHREGIAGEEDIDVTRANQPREVSGPARVHDDGSSHKDDPAPGRLYVAHDPGDPPNADLDAALG